MSTHPPGATVRIERTFDAPVRRGQAKRCFSVGGTPGTTGRPQAQNLISEWEEPSGSQCAIPPTDQDYGGGRESTVIEPLRRLAFTWTWDNDPSNLKLVEVEFTPRGEQTTVVLTNSGIPPRAQESHRQGWQNSFDNLDVVLRL